jgi:hypothetical protein
VSPSFSLELLDRLAKVFKDYCGVLTEEAIRKNFILIYELLDEMIVRARWWPGMAAAAERLGSRHSHHPSPHPFTLAPVPFHRVQDYGYPQSTSTEQLKMYVHNEPVPVESARAGGGGMSGTSKKTISSTAVQKPISLSTSSTGKKNEIFVDILERLTVLFNANVRSPASRGVAVAARVVSGGRWAPHDPMVTAAATPPTPPTAPHPSPAAGLRAQQHHRRQHPDEVVPQRQPGPAPGAQRGPCRGQGERVVVRGRRAGRLQLPRVRQPGRL